MATRTVEEVAELKRQWQRDPCWDLEDTEGYESYRDELAVFAEEQKAFWRRQTRERFLREGGGPAFSRASGVEGGACCNGAEGMTYRQWLIGQALQGLLARRDFKLFIHDGAEMASGMAAENACEIADAVLALLADERFGKAD